MHTGRYQWITTAGFWDAQQLNEARLAWLQKDPSTRYSPQGVIPIDNTVIDHDGKLIEDVGWFWDHAEQRNKIAHDYLIVNYVLWAGREDVGARKILVANRTIREVTWILRVYRRRWRETECFHRDGKQHVGMGHCQLRDGLEQTRHMYVVFLAHSVLMRHYRSLWNI